MLLKTKLNEIGFRHEIFMTSSFVITCLCTPSVVLLIVRSVGVMIVVCGVKLVCLTTFVG